MTIYERLNSELKDSMYAKNDVIRDYIKTIKSRITERMVAKKLNRNEPPEDELVLEVIASYKKSLEKAIEEFESGGDRSAQLVLEYKKEIEFCKGFLPEKVESTVDLDMLVDEAIAAIGNNAGKVMGYIMKNNKSLDGSAVKSVVIKKLQG